MDAEDLTRQRLSEGTLMRAQGLVRLVLPLLLLGWLSGLQACSGLPRVVVLHDALTAEEHMALGTTYEAQGARDLAAREYHAAMTDRTDYAPALVALGNLAFDSGALDEAEEYYRRALAIRELISAVADLRVGQAFGGTLTNLANVYHGVATTCQLSSVSSPLFKGLPQCLEIGRYHSWVVDKSGFPETLEITAEDDNGFIMGLQHKTYDVQGVQFHPESILTPDGEKILRNWLTV